MQGPMLDPQEHVRGEHQRLLREPVAQLWPALLRALSDEGLRVARADRTRGTIATGPVRYGARDVLRRLAEIGDPPRAPPAGPPRAPAPNAAHPPLGGPARG